MDPNLQKAMWQALNLQRPLVFFDIEATGLDIASDRIVSLAMLRLTPPDMFQPEGRIETLNQLFNPGRPMSEEVIAIHHITNEMVRDKPMFNDQAHAVLDWFVSADLAGYNLLNFDVPLLFEEFTRAGIEWQLDGVNIVDVSNIFRKKEERTLAAALRFYCGQEHAGAHDALADTQATLDVLLGQLVRYPDLLQLSVPQLAAWCKMDDRVDLAGKIVRNKEGVPCYNIGKSKGVPVEDDPSFGYWMLDRDFPSETKLVLRRLLDLADEPEAEADHD